MASMGIHENRVVAFYVLLVNTGLRWNCKRWNRVAIGL